MRNAAARLALLIPTTLSVALLPAGLHAQQAPAAPASLPADRAGGAAAVTEQDLRDWLDTLTSPEFAGRGTGQDGFRLAAEFVRDRLKAVGVEPGASGSWFQDLPWSRAEPDVESATLTLRRGDREVAIPGARLSGSVSQTLAARGEVVLMTGGPVGAMAESGNPDLAGKIVVLVQPEERDGGRGRGGRRGLFTALGEFQEHGVAAVLMAQTDAVDGGLEGRSAPRGGNRAERGRAMIPLPLTFGGDDLRALLELAGLDALPVAAGCHMLKVEAELNVPVTERAAPACNVVGVLRGSDPELADEYVVVGSHLDHLGRRGGTFFPGADDDGSGTSGVLAVATMLAKNDVRPARSVLFVCFCGEEMGLLGSRHFVRNPPIPLESITAELQMDMIGRNEEEARDGRRMVNRGETAEDNLNSLHVVGSAKLSPELHELCLRHNEVAGFDLESDMEDMFDRSDHANFARMGVPIAFFFTGLHRDYHQTTDTADKIDYGKLRRVATYVYDLAFELAQRPQRPRVDPDLWADVERKGRSTPAAPTLDGK